MRELPARACRPSRVLLAAAATVLLAATGGGGQRARGDDVAATYQQILGKWASGERTPAVRDLVALEQQWIADLTKLQEIQMRVLSRLAKLNHRSLVAGARLHQGAFRLHGYSQLMGSGAATELQTHAMRMNDQAVRLSLEHADDASEIRPQAAVLLTAMAVALRDYLFVPAAAQRLIRATELDPELAVACEWGGLVEEQRGRLSSAARLLRRLLELEPENIRGRLRLAMVETKRGHPAARGLLESIVESDHRSWVWIFAVEELAQDDARAGRTDDAVALLRRARAQYPGDQGLAVALAFHDRGRRGRSRAVLEALESRTALSSARVVYSDWQRLETFLAVVENLAAQSLPHLEDALRDTERR